MTSENTVRRVLLDLANESRIDRIGTGWKVKPKLKVQRA